MSKAHEVLYSNTCEFYVPDVNISRLFAIVFIFVIIWNIYIYENNNQYIGASERLTGYCIYKKYEIGFVRIVCGKFWIIPGFSNILSSSNSHINASLEFEEFRK